VHQLQRAAELHSGPALTLAIAQNLYGLGQDDLYTLLNQLPPEADLTVPLCHYLISSFSREQAPAQLLALVQGTPWEEPLRSFSEAYAYVYLLELQELLQHTKVAHFMYGRNCVAQELYWLEQWLQCLNIVPPHETPSRELFLSWIGAAVHLHRAGYGNPQWAFLLNDFGWLQRWRLDADTHAVSLNAYAHPLKQVMVKVQLNEAGQNLQFALQPHEVSSPAFNEAVSQFAKEQLAPLPVRLNSTYERLLREVVQATLGVAYKKSPSVEKVSEYLLISCLSHSQIQHIEDLRYALYTLVIELIAGTQNLKYRLNDCTRGLAQALATLNVTRSPEEAHGLLNSAIQALLDGVLEIYESFNLADNTLKSFQDSYQQAQGHWQHQRWQALTQQLAQS
jgi:hypothetical protein